MNKLFLLLLCSTIGLLPARAQDNALPDPGEPPYKKYPELPAFNMRLLDSVNIFNTFNIPKGQPALLVFFDPECSHCKDVTREIVKNMDTLKGIQMYWITATPSVTKLKKFYNDFHLADFPNVKEIGRDYEFFSLDYFRIRFIPTLVLYNAQKKFVHLFEGGAKPADIYERAFPLPEVKH